MSIWVSDCAVKLVTFAPAAQTAVTLAGLPKCLPVTVTASPPASKPKFGLTPVTIGRAGTKYRLLLTSRTKRLSSAST